MTRMIRPEAINSKIKRLISEQRGMTLLEAALGLGLLGLIGTVFLTSMSTSMISMALTEERANMNNLARAQMEYTKNCPYIHYIYGVSGNPDVPPDYVELDELDPSDVDAINIPDGYSIDVSAFVVGHHDPDNGIQQITVTINKNNKHLSLIGYKLDR